ncbi:RNase adapter RapZ [Microaceticoccus formicicus]|uniref:RNase adapter RapZ n=1 Tax=Microaceticoccus formicicus TaxID=3118105 RepID=UPI003CD04E83|nr:RNase adapter RapZ [Peptoniphilaceae bacterium AMB_02]
MEIVIITGMSGAGKSSALNILEDMGFYSMDNLPPLLIMSFAELTSRSEIVIERLAVGLDIRGVGFLENLTKSIEDLKKAGFDVSVLFLDASDEVLVKRYKELRRPHPMERQGNILNGIDRERQALENIRENSDYIIDTSKLKLAELKARISELYNVEGTKDIMIISIVSFGFKNGILLDADLVFDVRFLPNPYYIEELKEKTGKDSEVFDYVFSYDVTDKFLNEIMELLNFTVPYYEKEGKRNLIIGIGCTGGRHRSVAIAEKLGELIKEKYDLVFVSHRDERYW